MDYLRELGLERTINPTPEQIKKKWKDLCMKYHPDVGGDSEKFLKITHAYKMLSDPSYVNSNIDKTEESLLLRINYPVTFEDAFFGRKFAISYSVIELDTTLTPMTKESLETETLTFDVPEGEFNIQQMVFGKKGFRLGERRGDAIIVPSIIPHKKFKIEQRPTHFGVMTNTVAEERIPLSKMIKGGKIEVETMKGIKTVKIPPGTQPGGRLEIKKAGCKGGSHIVLAVPQFPDEPELKGKDWKGLNIEWNIMDEDLDEAKILETIEGIKACKMKS